MTNTYNTLNPLGSTSPKDLYDNASNFDEGMNSAAPSFHDRFGKRRETWAGMEKIVSDFLEAIGFEPTHLVYIDGSPLTVLRPTQLIDRDGLTYKVKQPASFPVELTGTWATDSASLVELVLDPNVGFISVTEYGALYNGVFDCRPAFLAAISSDATALYSPPGDCYLSSDVEITGKVLLSDGTVFVGPGRVTSAVVTYTANGMVFGNIESRTNWYQQPAITAGGQQQAIALAIGGAIESQGSESTLLFADGHSNFIALKPSEQFNPVEINFYNQSITGLAYNVAGTNRFIQHTDQWTPPPFTADMVGLAIYSEGVTYKIISFLNDREVGVSLWGGGAVSFPGTLHNTFHIVYSVFRGEVDTAGAIVTRKSGHTFQGYLMNTTSVLRINGVTYAIQTIDSEDQITLTTSAGTQTGVPYVSYADIEGETTAFRFNHSDIGEQLTIQTNAQDACYYIKTNAGIGKFRPIVIQNGGNTAVGIPSNGYVGIGKREPSAPLDVAGEIRGTSLALRTNSLENYANNGDSSVSINYSGYLGGNSFFRDTDIYNGKGGLMLRVSASNGNIGIGCSDPGEKLTVNGNAIPYVDNSFTCGSASRRWASVWAVNGTVQTSDRRTKTCHGKALGLDFINSLSAISYTYHSDPDKLRQGVVAQDLQKAYADAGVSNPGAIIEDSEGMLGVNYAELIASLVRSVQELSEEVNRLKKA